MTMHTLPAHLNAADDQRIALDVKVAPAGGPSPMWELVGYRHDGDQLHFNGDHPRVLFAMVDDLLLTPDVASVAVTIWLTE